MFKDIISELEDMTFEDDYIFKVGNIPVLFTAAHTMRQVREDGSIKSAEPFTKAMALYFNKKCESSYLIKIKDNGIDSNRDNHDEFKKVLIDMVKENKVKLVIDLHGADKNRDFDVEFGTLNNLTADFSTIKELEEAFIHNGIDNIRHNEPFKGGAITQYLYNLKDVEVIQLEINGRYRDYKNLDNLEKLCNSLIYFVNQLSSYMKEKDI